MSAVPTSAPTKLLIAALGGEGGGVLTHWIVSAAEQAGFAVQSTSIPGVAQRTGATTYYVEILPMTAADLAGKRPVLALTPGVGDIDIAVASELLEAGRTVANGFVTPDRTHVISSISRFYAMDEKIAMGDGRLDQDKLIAAVRGHARDCLLFDMDALAKQSGSIVNAVMLGAIAGSERLPIAIELLEAAIRADGKAVDSNIAGFRAGFEAARAKATPAIPPDKKRTAPATPDLLEHEVGYSLPALAQPTAIEGVRRLIAYQGHRYAQLYLNWLRAVGEAAEATDVGGRLLKEVARHLAVRMSYRRRGAGGTSQDFTERMRRIAREELRATTSRFLCTTSSSPASKKCASCCRRSWRGRSWRLAERKGWLGRAYFGMEINSTSVSGYLRFLLLAKLRALRPFGYRYKQEQEQIEAWLAAVAKAARQSAVLALEIAECARLIKGYGDTHARGLTNYRTIEERLIRPALAGHIPAPRAVDAIASARTAALLDPEGEGLAKCLGEIEGQSAFRIAAE